MVKWIETWSKIIRRTFRFRTTRYKSILQNFIFATFIIAADYNIEIRTGSEQIEPFDSPVYIQIYGTITTTPKLFLESKYAKDTIEKFNISSNNVGEVRKTNLLFSNSIPPVFLRYKKSLLDMKISVQLMIGI